MNFFGQPLTWALPLAVFLFASGLSGTAPVQGEPIQHRVLLRNDGLTLQPDLVIGRFGAGRLYFDRPTDVGVDDDGKVFVLDKGNNRVQVLDEDGEFLAEWGLKPDAGIGRDRPAALTVKRNDGTIFVLDGDRVKVQQYRADGSLMVTFGTGGLSSGHMDRPLDLDVDSFGYVYVLDQGRKKVLKYHRSGTFVKEWGEYGTGDDQFLDPVSMVFSDRGLGIIYVLDRGKPALMQFSTDGVFQSALVLKDVLPSERPIVLHLAVDRDGTVFIVEGTKWKLIKLDKRAMSVFSLTPGGEVGGIAFDEDGRAYLPDRKAHRLLRFTLEMN